MTRGGPPINSSVKRKTRRLNAHLRPIDQAVFAACGWPSDLSDEEILERLLALNLERSTGAKIRSE
jgi:hypothetical protein